MFSTKAGDKWHWRIGFDPSIDFCIWVLEMDGLHVSPFDQHARRDGSLQAAGLTQLAWKQWIHELISLRQYVSTTIENTPLEDLKNSKVAQLLRDPASACPGNPILKVELSNAWREYVQKSNIRRQHEKNNDKVVNSLMTSTLWDDLQIYRGLLPPLNIILVDYPLHVVFVDTPASIILSTGHRNKIEITTIQSNIMHSVKDLAKANREDP